MEWQALLGVIAIVGIVIVAGGLIAFLGHVIIGAFDNESKVSKQPKQEVMDYSQYKQNLLEAEVEKQPDFDFEAINTAKAEKEKQMLETSTEEDLYKLIDNNEANLDEIEARLKQENESKAEPVVKSEEKVLEPEIDVVTAETEKEVQPEEQKPVEEDLDEDDFDVMNLIDEINNEVVDEEKSKVQEEDQEENPILAQYDIDKILAGATDIEEEVENEVEEEPVEEELIEQPAKEVEEEKPEETQPEPVIEQEPVVDSKELEQANQRIAELTAQLESLNKQLNEQPATAEVVTINMTEEECLNRISVLEERLKNAKKDYKINMKEYRPLKKVMNDLDRYQTKLRRKETVFAKKKVALYGVNNYVDIDKEKQEELQKEFELLDGLRISVKHCEEIIEANKDRFPILERTNNILEEQISQLEEDLKQANITLQKIREDQGEDK